MVEFIYKTDFSLDKEDFYERWIGRVIQEEGGQMGDLIYTFCDDESLYRMNVEYLGHDTYTDIISFDDSIDGIIIGEMFISVDRVRENAASLGVDFTDEMDRVMIHGVLHYLGYKDKTEKQAFEMRKAEDRALMLRTDCLS